MQYLRGAFTFTLRREGNFRLQKEMGGGSIWDVGCYPISYMIMLVGSMPLDVFGWQVSGKDGIDISFVGQLRFPNGNLAQFDSGFQSPNRSEVEVIGSLGTLLIPNPFKPGKREKILLKRKGKIETIKIIGQELYLGEVEDMADAILLGKSPRVSLEDSRANVVTIQALLKSAKSGVVITL